MCWEYHPGGGGGGEGTPVYMLYRYVPVLGLSIDKLGCDSNRDSANSKSEIG